MDMRKFKAAEDLHEEISVINAEIADIEKGIEDILESKKLTVVIEDYGKEKICVLSVEVPASKVVDFLSERLGMLRYEHGELKRQFDEL